MASPQTARSAVPSVASPEPNRIAHGSKRPADVMAAAQKAQHLEGTTSASSAMSNLLRTCEELGIDAESQLKIQNAARLDKPVVSRHRATYKTLPEINSLITGLLRANMAISERCASKRDSAGIYAKHSDVMEPLQMLADLVDNAVEMFVRGEGMTLRPAMSDKKMTDAYRKITPASSVGIDDAVMVAERGRHLKDFDILETREEITKGFATRRAMVAENARSAAERRTIFGDLQRKLHNLQVSDKQHPLLEILRKAYDITDPSVELERAVTIAVPKITQLCRLLLRGTPCDPPLNCLYDCIEILQVAERFKEYAPIGKMHSRILQLSQTPPPSTEIDHSSSHDTNSMGIENSPIISDIAPVADSEHHISDVLCGAPAMPPLHEDPSQEIMQSSISIDDIAPPATPPTYAPPTVAPPAPMPEEKIKRTTVRRLLKKR